MIHLARRHAIVLAILACGCKKAEPPAEDTKPVVAVQTMVVTTRPFTETVGAIGTVAARTGRSATMSASVAGRFASLQVKQGQSVTEGQPLIQLDPAPFRTASTSAQAALSAAQSAYDRANRLATAGIVPRKDAEQAAADLARAKADDETAQRMVTLSVLHAPIGGVVTRVIATPGASIDVGQPLVEIADPTAVDILLNLTPTDAGKVHPGAHVELRGGQTEAGEPLGSGTVIDIAPMVDSATRGVAVRVQAPTTRRPLRIGETVFGAITVASRPSALSVPLEALVPEGDGFKVFVVDDGNIAHETDVEVGARTTTLAEITSGLKVGQRVVTSGAYGLEDSVTVTTEKEGETDKDAAPGKEIAPGKKGARPPKDAVERSGPPPSRARRGKRRSNLR